PRLGGMRRLLALLFGGDQVGDRLRVPVDGDVYAAFTTGPVGKSSLPPAAVRVSVDFDDCMFYILELKDRI
ncbi:hypothetical protein, partial [Streptomyces sp. NPDC059753]|uniref:hypothetical protein n=1 Tax=Streptomyces sp. NPDC059753 TaxID=3346933 RepID=UPI0036611282